MARNLYASHRPVQNAYLVRERDRRRMRELLLVVAAVLPVAAMLILYIAVQLEVLDTGYRINVLERRQDRLLEEERRLRLEAAYLTSPQRLETRAIEDLGLERPAFDQMIWYGELP